MTALRWALAHPLHFLVVGLFSVLAIDHCTRPRPHRASGCSCACDVSIASDGGAHD